MVVKIIRTKFSDRLNTVEYCQCALDNIQINGGICKLPFDFPIISNGGNDILIYKNKRESTEV
jgi:hypothetical protein